jgi:acetyl/propionyl-CoA carboxylase alpha subunit
VIEEAPSSVTPELRKKMGEAAVLVAKSVIIWGAER